MDGKNIQEDNNYVVHGPNVGSPLPKETMGRDLQRSLLNAPSDSVAMIDVFTNKKLLHRDLFQQSVNLAQALRICGYTGQETVLALSSENSLNFFIPVVASLFNGSIMAPLNHIYTPYELEHTMNISTPKVVFCSPAVAQKFIDLTKKLPYIERILILDDGPLDLNLNVPGLVQTMNEFIRSVLGGGDVNVRTFEPVDGDNSKMAALILCSSGTTGLPKGVTLTHLNMKIRAIHSRNPDYFVQETSQNILGLLPFFHSYGMSVGITAIGNHNTVICLSKFEEDAFLKAIQDYKINTLALAPPLALLLAKSEKVDKYNLSSVTGIYCGAAPLSKSTEEEVKRRLNCYSMRQGYGLTETTLAVTMIHLNDLKPGSCGKIVPYTSCKVRDPESGRSLGPNQVGELCWKGPLVMLGYYRNEQANRETFTSDGWLKSGDLGYYDEQGYFYIIDRLKELIKYKGYQVAPAELEAILINHPKIADVGVVGLPDELVGERPLAFVVKKSDVNITEKEVQKYVADIVSPQKRLTGGVIFVDSIPKNQTGKILRRELREMLKTYSKKVIESKL